MEVDELTIGVPYNVLFMCVCVESASPVGMFETGSSL